MSRRIILTALAFTGIVSVSAQEKKEQDYQRVIRKEDAEDVVPGEEKGYNTYTKADDSRCKAALDYWTQHAEKWAKVRAKWDEVFSRKVCISPMCSSVFFGK